MTQKTLLLACGILSFGLLSAANAKDYSCPAKEKFGWDTILFESAKIDNSELVCEYFMKKDQSEHITLTKFLPKEEKCNFKETCEAEKKCTVTCKK